MDTTIAKNKSMPTYRGRKGYSQAIVTLTDAVTQKRKDYWLGEHGTPGSHEMYHRVLADWESCGRRFPAVAKNADGETTGTTIGELTQAYWKHASSYYTPAAAGHIKTLIRLMGHHFGCSPANSFGPNDLRLAREAMINGDSNADPPRKPWSRCYVNSQVHRLCRMFKWAASHEMIPIEVYHRLKSVPALRRGRSTARETDSIQPVAIELVDAVRPFLSRQVRALADLQLLTGARGGELFKLRPIDIQIDKKKGVWTFNLGEHKMAYLGCSRTIYIGPKAQKIIEPFLKGRPSGAYLFSPAGAEQERRAARAAKRETPRSCGNVSGTNCVESPRKKPGTHYTSGSYRNAILRACDKAGIDRWHPTDPDSGWALPSYWGLFPESERYVVPIDALWHGFAINTIFYAAVLWILIAMPFAVRRRRRIKRGLCPACAYPVGGSPVCTECGKPLKQKAETQKAEIT